MTAAGRWTDLADWRGPTPNHGGPMTEVRGLVAHIAEGFFGGTISWQTDPANQVSSHFVVGDGKQGSIDGEIAQMVEVDVTAWTQAAGNGHWISAEFAGFSGHPLTAAQVEAAAWLLARCHHEFGVPLQTTVSPNGRGLGHHSMGGVAWGDHPDCPGSPVIAQKQAIVDRAKAIVNGDAGMPLTNADADKIWKSPQVNNDQEPTAKESMATTFQRMRQDLDEIRQMLATLPTDIAAAFRGEPPAGT